MKNKLIDLNDHLFCQVERLSDETTKGKELEEEIKRAKAITDVATRIIENGRLALGAEKARAEYTGKIGKLPAMLEADTSKT